MENNANYALVGALATAIIAALFAFVYWFAGPSSNVPMKAYDVVFTGTVSGIGRGTDVQFNGIKVGQVRNVALDPTDTANVVARIEVNAGTPVKADTRVLMGFQGLTGVGSVQLSGGTDTAGEPPVTEGHSVPTLHAEVSDFQSILDGLSATINGTSTAVSRLNGFLDTNDEKLNTTIANVETFSTALASNADGIEAFMASVSDAGQEIGPLAEEITKLSSDTRKLVNAVSPDQVAKAVSDVTSFTDSLSRNSGKVDEFFTTTAELSKNLNDLTIGLKDSMDVIDKVTAEIDPTAIGRVVDNVDTLSANMTSLTANINGIVETIPTGQIEQVIADVGTFAETLARNSGAVDTFVASASDLTKTLGAMAADLSPSIDVINATTAEIDPQAIGRLIDNADNASQELSTLATDLRGLAAAVPTADIQQVVADVGVFTDTLARNSTEIDKFFETTSTLSTTITSFVDGLNASAKVINEVAAGIDPQAIGRVIDNVDAFSRKLGDNADNVDTIVANVTSVSNGLTGSVDQVNEILAKINDTVSSTEGQGLFEELSAAAKSVRLLADQLNASTSNIAVGLNSFTSRGLASYTSLAEEARATLQSLDRVVRNLESNPQGLIFGGETVREYNKR
ncbi:MlaD family protein [Devosia algicola]|uniref:MlaD family protein n=1 Tax=Devosia algicola TaxID=3026418 RepID=A0ABY7YPR6_9HYPH|nr:MlaD family protein [Devosia algicola]WDR03306.1 MlaD family protein [Devosia algicola]